MNATLEQPSKVRKFHLPDEPKLVPLRLWKKFLCPCGSQPTLEKWVHAGETVFRVFCPEQVLDSVWNGIKIGGGLVTIERTHQDPTPWTTRSTEAVAHWKTVRALTRWSNPLPSEEATAADCQYNWPCFKAQISLVFRHAVCICGASPILQRRLKEVAPNVYRGEYRVCCQAISETDQTAFEYLGHQTTDWRDSTKEAISFWVVTHYLAQPSS